MSEEFVRKDVHDVEIRRIDERIDSAVFRMEAKTEVYMAKMQGSFEEMKAQNASFREYVSNELSHMRADVQNIRGDVRKMQGEMSALNSKVDNISRNVALIMTIAGLAISAVSILIQFMR